MLHIYSAAVLLLGACLLPGAVSTRYKFGLTEDLQTWILSGGRNLLQDAVFDPESLASPKIFKGINVQPKRYDCMVSLRKPGSNIHYCGGVLIRPNIVLTAAHCMDSGFEEVPGARDDDDFKGGFSQPNPVSYVGASRVDIIDPDAEAIPSCSTIVHSGWGGRLIAGYDLAIIKLQWPSVKTPCPIYRGDPLSNGQRLTALGWGQSEDADFLPTLQRVGNLVFEDRQSCNTDDKWLGYMKPGMICADGPTGEDTCDGDSGGPLLLEGATTGGDQVVGITSFGHVAGCGIPGLPGVYTDTKFYQRWIDTEGANISRVYDVAFCGNPTPDTGDPKDDIAASVANDDIPGAVTAIGRSFDADDLASIEAAVQNVSDVGLAELAIKAVVSAAHKGVITEVAAIPFIGEAIERLPPPGLKLLSGGQRTELEKELYEDIKGGNVWSASQKIVEALNRSTGQDVLKAIYDATNDGESGVISACLNSAVDHGIDRVDLVTVLAPLCVGQGIACCEGLLAIGSSNEWTVSPHSLLETETSPAPEVSRQDQEPDID